MAINNYVCFKKKDLNMSFNYWPIVFIIRIRKKPCLLMKKVLSIVSTVTTLPEEHCRNYARVSLVLNRETSNLFDSKQRILSVEVALQYTMQVNKW